MESQIQSVVRAVVAQYLRNPDIDQAGRTYVADLLESGDPDLVAQLREDIAKASDRWSDEVRLVAVRNESIYWRIRAKRVDGGPDGPIVELRWGWDPEGPPGVVTIGQDAFDLAAEILAMFEDETGEICRPERPKHEMPDDTSRLFDSFMDQATQFMEAIGDKGGCSWLEVKAWVLAGKPVPVPVHEYVAYPEDKVAVCSVCGYYVHTDDDEECLMRACPGRPVEIDGLPSVHRKDPRRSERLREAQRLDQIATVLRSVDATQAELGMFEARRDVAVALLDDADLARFERERVGLGHD